MAARLFPINVPLTIVWQFTKPDNTNFDITGYSPRLYYRSGNRETEVPSTMISKTGNTLSFTFPTTWPRFEGEYHLKLLLFQNNALWETFHYRQAWAFVRTAIPGSQEATQQNAGQTVHLFTCAEYYLFQPIIPTVDSDGYWVVNGTRVTDGSGNPVPSSHTVTYDAETNQIIIDQGRVDKNGNSIAQTITALDDALDNQQELYEAAEGTQSGSVSGDGSRWGSYKAAEAARNAARTTAEGTKNGSTAGDGSMWGEYKAAEAARNTARAASEGTKTGSVAGDGSMWGAFKEGEAARNEASENQEGTKAFSTESDGTRWGEYKNAERERDEARLAAEGSKQRSNAGDGTRWGDYKTAEGERDLQYAKEEGTAASEAHDGTRWGEYKAAEEERDASESRRDSTFNELASDMRSATSAANTAAGAANTAAAGANTAAGKANAAAGRAPYIGENGHWYAWDIESGQYADTGVAALSNSRYEVVSELPDEGDGNILYLVGPNQQGAYDEYVYTKDGEFVQVGSTYVDLEEKVSSDDIDNIIELTQEEFDALQSKDPRAMYIVTNAVPDSDHVGIASLVQTTVATADEGVNVWTCTLTNGQTFTLNVKNGSRGNSGYTGAAGELEVVNALNSDDATAALSAYQGKVLDGKIDQLGQKVGAFVELENGSISSTDGSEGSSTNRVRTKQRFDAPVLVSTASGYECRPYIYSAAGVFQDTLAWGSQHNVTDTTKTYKFLFRKTNDADLTAEEAAQNCTFVNGYKYMLEKGIRVDVQQSFTSEEKNRAHKNLGLDEEPIENSTNLVESGGIYKTAIKFVKFVSANLHNDAPITPSTSPAPTDGSDWDGHSLSKDNGQPTANSSYRCTYFIPVVAGQSYKSNVGLRRLCYYYQSGTFNRADDNVAENAEIVIPANTFFVRIMYMASGVATPADLKFGLYSDDINVPYFNIEKDYDSKGRELAFAADMNAKTEALSEDISAVAAQSLKKELKVLLIGSSLGVNTIIQFPLLASALGIKVTCGNLYKGSGTLAEWAALCGTSTAENFGYFTPEDGAWHSTSKTVDQALDYADWDVIILQRGAQEAYTWTNEQSAAFGSLIDYIRTYVDYSPKIMLNCTPARSLEFFSGNRQSQIDYTKDVMLTARQAQDEYGIEIIPTAIAIQNARNTLLAQYGTYDGGDSAVPDLNYDVTHLDIGVGSYVLGVVLVEQLVTSLFGEQQLTSDYFPTASELVARGVWTADAYTDATTIQNYFRIANAAALSAVRKMWYLDKALAIKYPMPNTDPSTLDFGITYPNQ